MKKNLCVLVGWKEGTGVSVGVDTEDFGYRNGVGRWKNGANLVKKI